MVGLVEFDGYYAADITRYESLANLPNVPLQKVLLDGFNGVPVTGITDANSEVALDIEMVISMAPGLSKVVVYEAGPNGQPLHILSAMSTNTAIKQFSCSWDFGDLTSADRKSMDGYFKKMALDGQSFFNASGDTGAFTGDWPPPDDDPYITLVGGTALATCAPGGAWLSETAWNAPDYRSHLGGLHRKLLHCRLRTLAAGHQHVRQPGLDHLAEHPGCRDGGRRYSDRRRQRPGGSVRWHQRAVQLWAGFNALVNQQAATSGQPSVGFINPAIYALGKSGSFSAVFNDITAGNNNTNGIPPSFSPFPAMTFARAGVPRPAAASLALATPDLFVVTPGSGFAANGPVGGPFSVTAQNLSLTNAGADSLNWSLSNTSLWLNVSSASGTLTPGGAAATVTVSLNAAANNLAAGVYTANLQLTNTTVGSRKPASSRCWWARNWSRTADSRPGILLTGI